MLKGCGHDVGGYQDTHWNFYGDVMDRMPEVIRLCHTGPVINAL